MFICDLPDNDNDNEPWQIYEFTNKNQVIIYYSYYKVKSNCCPTIII